MTRNISPCPTAEEAPCGTTSSSTRKARRCRGWLYVPDGATGPAPTIVMCHGLQRGQGVVPRRVRRGLLRGGVLRAGLRQPQPRRERRRAAAGDRPAGADARLPRTRSPSPRTLRRGRRRPDRHLGLELQRRACARRRARSTGA